MKSGFDMTQGRFFQICLFFPFVLWLTGMVVFSFIYKLNSGEIIKNALDALRVFVPYLVFAAVLWRLANNKTFRQLTFFAFVAPMAWGIFFTLCYILHTYIINPAVDKSALWMMAFWATVVAYLMEVIPYIVLSIFRNDFRAAPVPGSADSALAQPSVIPDN